jgi:hypothetical protein
VRARIARLGVVSTVVAMTAAALSTQIAAGTDQPTTPAGLLTDDKPCAVAQSGTFVRGEHSLIVFRAKIARRATRRRRGSASHPSASRTLRHPVSNLQAPRAPRSGTANSTTAP